jgi:hypothetical protein
MPSWETNCIEDWETKIDAIVEETFDENMTIISGILRGCKCILSVCNKKVNGKILGKFSLYLWRVNFEPYRAKFENLIGRKVDSIECFRPQRIFAYQDSQKECCCC